MLWDEDTLAQVCAETLINEDHSGLLNSIGKYFGDKPVSLAFVKPEWYRVGGLVDSEDARLCENLRDWVESHETDDVLSLYELHGDEPLYVTRITGKTLCLVVPEGKQPLDFLQIEVDVLQEVVDRLLFDEDNMPDDFEDLIDPMEYSRAEPRELSLPRYQFRRVRNLLEVQDSLTTDNVFKRFYEEWQASSAADSGHFSDFWVLDFHKYKDAFGEISTEVKPLSRQKRQAPALEVAALEKGQPLGRAIHEFDRKVGYPMAWYFFMLTSQKNFHKLAEMVHDDLMGAYAYLPAKDLKILKSWIADPYCF